MTQSTSSPVSVPFLIDPVKRLGVCFVSQPPPEQDLLPWARNSQYGWTYAKRDISASANWIRCLLEVWDDACVHFHVYVCADAPDEGAEVSFQEMEEKLAGFFTVATGTVFSLNFAIRYLANIDSFPESAPIASFLQQHVELGGTTLNVRGAYLYFNDDDEPFTKITFHQPPDEKEKVYIELFAESKGKIDTGFFVATDKLMRTGLERFVYERIAEGSNG